VIQAVVGYVIFFSDIVLPGTFRKHFLRFVTFQNLQYFVDVTTGGSPIDSRPVSCVLIGVILVKAIGASLRGRPFCASSEQIPSGLSGWEDNLRLGR
jgi:hypothetical protein